MHCAPWHYHDLAASTCHLRPPLSLAQGVSSDQKRRLQWKQVVEEEEEYTEEVDTEDEVTRIVASAVKVSMFTAAVIDDVVDPDRAPGKGSE